MIVDSFLLLANQCVLGGGGILSLFCNVSFVSFLFLAHLSHSDKVSFCDRSLSVVHRLLTIDLNDISS